MKFILKQNDQKITKAEFVACLVTQQLQKNKKDTQIDAYNSIKELDKLCNNNLLSLAQSEGFDGGLNQVFTTNVFNGDLKSVTLLGLGSSLKHTLDDIRQAAGKIFKIANKKKYSKVCVTLPIKIELATFDLVQAIAEGMILSSYSFDKYKIKDEEKGNLFVKEVEILINESVDNNLKKAISRAEIIAQSILHARELINEPPIVLNPVYFAQEAQKIAQKTGLKIEILDEKALKKENMGLMLAVGQGTLDFAPPRLIKLSYTPDKASKKTVALVGKGVTFDSGGLDIKPADGMLDMKVDMSGAAAVLSVMNAAAQLKLNLNLVGYLACVENAVDSKSYHPGDIFKSRKGLHVEISNTDAEGRLVLADAITYAQDKDNPDILIDIATLTGACMVALGIKRAGLYSNDENLAKDLLELEKNTGEKFWRMPLDQELLSGLKTPNADYKNCADRWGGSITAALFLQLFINQNVKWAHLDIAGPATNSKDHAYLSKGGTGFAIKTLVEYLSSL